MNLNFECLKEYGWLFVAMTAILPSLDATLQKLLQISTIVDTDVSYPRLIIISKTSYQNYHQLKTRDKDPRTFLGSFLEVS